MTASRWADWRSWAPATKRALKLALAGLVLAGLVRHVMRVRADLDARALALHFDPAGLLAAGGLYLAGLVACGAYFWRVLAAGPTPVGPYPAIRAYLISHLAKYVPGKAMVVVVRSALVAPDGARPAASAFATLYETLVMMAAGGLLAGAGLLAVPRSGAAAPGSPGDTIAPPGSLAALGFAAGAGFLVLVWPGVFPRLAGLIRRPLRGVGADAVPRLSTRLLLEGLAWAALGWTLLGLSQVAVIRAVGVGAADGPTLGAADWPTVVASVALATVAGFAVPIAPGGLGVREWVLWTSLAATLDRDRAVVAALVLRLVWVAAEVAVALALLPIRPRSRAAG